MVFKQINIKKILVIVIKIGLFLSLFLPFIITKSTFFPYIFGRSLIFQLLIEIFIIFWTALIIFYPAYRPKLKLVSSKSGSWLRRLLDSPQILLNWAVIIFLISSALSSVLGVNVARSFWGTQERMTGFFTLLHFGFFYFMLVSVMRTKRDWVWFLRGIALGSMIVSLNIVYFGIVKSIYRPFAWLGSPGIAGTFLLFSFFLNLVWYWIERSLNRRRKMKIFFFSLLILLEILIGLAIFTNGSRAVWVGMFLSILIVLLIWPYFFKTRSQHKVRKAYILCLIVIFVVSLMSVLAVTDNLPATVYQRVPAIHRLKSVISIDAGRIMSWQQGLKSWRDRPIFGYGPENYQIAFNKYYNPEIAKLSSWGLRLQFDKAHNQQLEHLVNNGILGLIVYLALFAGLICVVYKKKGIESLIFVALISAYFIQNLFTFDTPISYWLFFIVIALVSFFGNSTDNNQPDIIDSNQKTRRNIIGTVSITVVAVLVLLVMYFVQYRSYIASEQVAIARAARKEPVETSFYFYYESLQHKPVQAFEIRDYMGVDLLSKVAYLQEKNEFMLIFASSELEKNSRNDYHSLLLLGQIYNILGTSDVSYYRLAQERLESASELANNRYAIHVALSVTYLKLSDFQASIESIEKAMEFGYEPIDVLEFFTLGLVYGEVGDLDKSLEYYNKALDKDPKNIQTLGSLAALYKELGEIKKARQIAEQILEIDSSLEVQIKLFMEELDQISYP